jgi:hypothetical protein
MDEEDIAALVGLAHDAEPACIAVVERLGTVSHVRRLRAIGHECEESRPVLATRLRETLVEPLDVRH